MNDNPSENASQQHWLTVTPHRQRNGMVLLEYDIHGHFGTGAVNETPQAIREAVGGLFAAMAEHVEYRSIQALSEDES